MAISQLKAGAVLSYVVIALNSLVGIVYTPFMLRMLGQSEYGIYSLAVSIIAYLGIMDLGFGNAIIRYVAKFRAINDKEREGSLLGMFSTIYVVIGIITLLLGGLVASNVDSFFERSLDTNELSQTRTIMFLLAFNLAITFFFNVYSSAITAYEDFIFQKVIQIVRIILNTIVMIVLLYCGYKAIALVVCQTVFNILTQILNFYYFHYKLQIRIIWGKYDWRLFKEICSYSIWIFITAIIDRLYWSTGPFILGAELGTVAVAVFSVAMTLEHIFISFSTAISGVFLPRITSMIAKESSNEEISELFLKTGRLQFIVICLVVSAFVVFGQSFISLWAGNGYNESYLTALLLFLGLIVPLIQNIGISILQARNNLKFRAICYFILSVGCVGGQYILSKHYGAVGCALAITITLLLGQGLVMNLYYWRKQKINIPKFWGQIIKISIVPVLLTMTATILFYFTGTNICSWGELFGFGILYCVAYAVLIYTFTLNEYEKDLLAGSLLQHIKQHD